MTDVPTPQADNDRLRHALRQTLESLAGAGVRQLPGGGETLARWREGAVRQNSSVTAAEPMPEVSGATAALFMEEELEVAKKRATSAPAAAKSGDGGDISTAKTLKILAQEVAGCTRCHELASTRTQTVFGVGDPQARLVFLGEAPGADEDKQGEPFVGRAGQLLTKIIEAIGLTRQQVYIANVIKCRPPGNRNPEQDEVATCEPFLFEQIAAIRPKVVVALGKFAAQSLLRSTEPITKLRGRVFEFRGASLIPTFHPAYLLRNPPAKREVWEDMKKVRDMLQS
jgi:uracil-DNA glycosylase family 4